MKRKICIILLAFAAVAAGIFGLAACKGGEDSEEPAKIHDVHEYGEWVVVTAPSCTKSGLQRRTCECGAYQEEELPSPGHSLDLHRAAKEPTCTETGWYAYDECTVEGCGYTTKKDIATLPHTYVDYKCTVCHNDMYEVSASGVITKFNGSSESPINVPSYVYGITVTEIGSSAFEGSGVTNVVIQEGITKIGSGAFLGCHDLRTIVIPNSVTEIEGSVFWECDSMIYNQDPQTNAYYLGNSSNRYLVYIKPVQNTISEIRINKDTKIIYSGAFTGCSNLESVTLNDNLIYGTGLFADCTSLKTVNLPDTMTEISDYMFTGCAGFESISIPETITVIGNGAFSGCTSLTSITIPDSVTSIGDSAFSKCTSLTSITIPDSITSIGNSTFSGCTDLTSIEIPSSVTKIGNSAFSGCTSLEEIEIPESVNSIGSGAFSGCGNLKSVVLPDGITRIVNMFQSCTKLEWVYIPLSVTSIGANMFADCRDVKVYYAGAYENWSAINKSGAMENATIYLYSEGTPTGDYRYWHLNAKGEPEVW